ncbi:MULTISPECIES: hypothetical protein [Pandoraea]|nr:MULTISPECIES: hypothetical protein [Pandoraea]
MAAIEALPIAEDVFVHNIAHNCASRTTGSTCDEPGNHGTGYAPDE